MSSIKEIYISNIKMGSVNKVSVKPDIKNNDPLDTFDGSIPSDANGNITWKISIDKYRYSTVSDYDTVDALLLRMIRNPEDVMIIERKTGVDGTIIKKQLFSDCKVSNNEYTLDASSDTVENLELTGSNMEQWNSKGEKVVW